MSSKGHTLDEPSRLTLLAIAATWTVAAMSYGIGHGDYHVLGLIAGLQGFLGNPLGQGLGIGGNLSSTSLTLDWDNAQATRVASVPVESAVGVMLYQMGIGSVVFFGFLAALANTARKLFLKTVNPEFMFAFSGGVTISTNAVFQEEAFYSPLAFGFCLLLVGTAFGTHWREESSRAAGRAVTCLFPATPGSCLVAAMAFSIRQLQFFIAVAEQGTVSGAAQNLSISQSSVTEAIKELEHDLGVELFERHSRGLNITHKGHQFLRHATKILADVSDARRAFSDEQATAGGKLQLGVTSLVAGYVLSDLLARYRRAYPGVDVSAIEDNGDYLEHLLIGGKLDIAVMVTTNLRDRMALQSEILEVSAYRLWLPLSHRLTSTEIIGIGDLAGEPLIMLTVDEIEESTGKLLAAIGAKPHIAFRTRSVEAVRSLVATGAGVALLPDLVYRPWSLEGDRIEQRDISGSLPVVQVGMVWRRGSGLPQAARDFIGIAQSQRTVRQRI